MKQKTIQTVSQIAAPSEEPEEKTEPVIKPAKKATESPSSHNQTIIIKRVKKVAGGHHGGAWKIAYADFVTAMMAFFLLMWLLASVNKAKLEGIAEYFKQPLKVFDKGGKGLGENAPKIKVEINKNPSLLPKNHPPSLLLI